MEFSGSDICQLDERLIGFYPSFNQNLSIPDQEDLENRIIEMKLLTEMLQTAIEVNLFSGEKQGEKVAALGRIADKI